MRGLACSFLGEAGDPRDPLANLLYADLAGLGPVYIQAGGDETLLDDARRLDSRAGKAGVDTRLDVFPGMLHTFQMAGHGTHHALGVAVLTATPAGITRITVFAGGPDQVTSFGLPATV